MQKCSSIYDKDGQRNQTSKANLKVEAFLWQPEDRLTGCSQSQKSFLIKMKVVEWFTLHSKTDGKVRMASKKTALGCNDKNVSATRWRTWCTSDKRIVNKKSYSFPYIVRCISLNLLILTIFLLFLFSYWPQLYSYVAK